MCVRGETGGASEGAHPTKAHQTILLDSPAVGVFGPQRVRARVEPLRLPPAAECGPCGGDVGLARNKVMIECVEDGLQ